MSNNEETRNRLTNNHCYCSQHGLKQVLTTYYNSTRAVMTTELNWTKEEPPWVYRERPSPFKHNSKGMHRCESCGNWTTKPGLMCCDLCEKMICDDCVTDEMWELPAENGGRPWVKDVWYCPSHELKTGDEVDLTSENINTCVTLNEEKQDKNCRRFAYENGATILLTGVRRMLVRHTDTPSYVTRVIQNIEDSELPSHPITPP